MLEPEHLSPENVLAHLNDLGFRDVTSQQLKEFLHDLKKLIRYEQKHLNRRCGECRPATSTTGDSSCFCGSSGSEEISEKSTSQEESYSSSIATDCSSTTCKSVEDNERLTVAKKPKVPSSFIRPRNLSSHKDSASYKQRKQLDPVSLYHHYKELWKKNKIPGQTNHPQLRWNIRNKMLGQEPESRVFSSNNNF